MSNPMIFTIYGTSSCLWCDKAKALLYERGHFYEYVDINEDSKAKDFILSMGFTTVPQVYLDDIYIGGYEALEAALEEVT